VSVRYEAVQWTRPKVVYDVVLVAVLAAYLAAFPVLSKLAQPRIDAQVVQMRAFGSAAFLMLTFILCIGPLARFDRRFIPLLYNRRHFGVLMCAVALLHWNAVAGWYFAYSRTPAWVATLTRDTHPLEGSAFPLFGVIALAILVVMALTSHDFWQKVLGAGAWKSLHMLVYVAYAAVVCHVAFGALQWETHPGFVAVFIGGAATVVTLHILAARRSTELDAAPHPLVEHEGETWIDAGPPERIPRQRALPVIPPTGERIALVRDGDRVTALHGVCAHQGGPLYEGKVIDGCLTCPWHGWQYKAEDGCSPPPFEETIPTYRIALSAKGRILVHPTPLPPGTPAEPVIVPSRGAADPGSAAAEAPA
jgi:DMSO/TMAO reductase YedYZ heme-binding membrane subunit/nitrite reductase/ring-hydroxylating ferredoxin subunit